MTWLASAAAGRGKPAPP